MRRCIVRAIPAKVRCPRSGGDLRPSAWQKPRSCKAFEDKPELLAIMVSSRSGSTLAPAGANAPRSRTVEVQRCTLVRLQYGAKKDTMLKAKTFYGMPRFEFQESWVTPQVRVIRILDPAPQMKLGSDPENLRHPFSIEVALVKLELQSRGCILSPKWFSLASDRRPDRRAEARAGDSGSKHEETAFPQNIFDPTAHLSGTEVLFGPVLQFKGQAPGSRNPGGCSPSDTLLARKEVQDDWPAWRPSSFSSA